MNLLVKCKEIVAAAHKISFGVFDEPFEKWRIADADDNLMYYYVDSDFQLIENVTLPEDYVDGLYFYENGEFVVNEDWEPYVSPEERIAALEEENAYLAEQAVMLEYTMAELMEVTIPSLIEELMMTVAE